MKGTYLEYICPICGWFPSIKTTQDNDAKSKKILNVKIHEHNKKHTSTADVMRGRE